MATVGAGLVAAAKSSFESSLRSRPDIALLLLGRAVRIGRPRERRREREAGREGRANEG